MILLLKLAIIAVVYLAPAVTLAFVLWIYRDELPDLPAGWSEIGAFVTVGFCWPFVAALYIRRQVRTLLKGR
jgi:hypothetical protein